ncbi:tetratricopeptide repeat protein [Eikenella sp. NML03-A-027]|uniref:tetratricopeptide repeat protein n=1 Tax=Eikenella sp. NML03-A-027 TaxID=1795828 RepID=UPI00350F0707
MINPKSLYRATLLEYLHCASFSADLAEASTACRTYRKLAKKGCPNNWFVLGRARQYGYGVKPNLAKAEKHYHRAANYGHAEAQEAIGYLYEKGLGLPQNHAKARKWYARTALQVDAAACNNLGFNNGKGACPAAKNWRRNSTNSPPTRVASLHYPTSVSCMKM